MRRLSQCSKKCWSVARRCGREYEEDGIDCLKGCREGIEIIEEYCSFLGFFMRSLLPICRCGILQGCTRLREEGAVGVRPTHLRFQEYGEETRAPGVSPQGAVFEARLLIFI